MNKLEIKVKPTLSYRRTTCVSRGPDGAAFMTGVFDGHAGPYNAQAVRKDFIFIFRFTRNVGFFNNMQLLP